MATELGAGLEKKIDLLINLFAIGIVNGKTQRDQIRLLSLAGMGPKEISDLIGTTPNTVNVALAGMRKKNQLNLKPEGVKQDAG